MLSPQQRGLNTDPGPRFFPDIDDISAKHIEQLFEMRVEVEIKTNFWNPWQSDIADFKREVYGRGGLKIVPGAIVSPLVSNQDKELNLPGHVKELCSSVPFCLITAGV